MVHFVGAGSGAVDLITLRGQRHLERADVMIYAGSLVNPALLKAAKADCEIHDSAKMTLEEIISVMERAQREGKTTVRLHTGDPSLYGAICEQISELAKRGVPYDITPGVSSFCASAAALGVEYTPPGISQSLIITRMAGRTPVPALEGIEAFARHRSSMAIFLSAGMLEALKNRLIEGGYPPSTPAALVYKASWPDEKTVLGSIERLPDMAREHGITKTALVLVGEFLKASGVRSLLYDPSFTHEFREGTL